MPTSTLDAIINYLYITPSLIFYLLLMDIVYTILTLILMPLVLLISIIARRDVMWCYEKTMNKFMLHSLKLNKMDVLGLRR